MSSASRFRPALLIETAEAEASGADAPVSETAAGPPSFELTLNEVGCTFGAGEKLGIPFDDEIALKLLTVNSWEWFDGEQMV